MLVGTVAKLLIRIQVICPATVAGANNLCFQLLGGEDRVPSGGGVIDWPNTRVNGDEVEL